jgi:hypothetical protein
MLYHPFAWLFITCTSNYSDVTKTASNYYYFKITRKLLQNYFGSAFRELGTVFIVITIRTKFLDIISLEYS